MVRCSMIDCLALTVSLLTFISAAKLSILVEQHVKAYLGVRLHTRSKY
jgi:hypothetical protein